MKIIEIKPRGFCNGVAHAINVLEKVLKDKTTKKPIYMLGSIVHNKNVVKHFEDNGVIILHGISRAAMLEQVQSGSVVITAHGASDNIKAMAKKKGLDVIDATCHNVTKTHTLIKSRLAEGFTVFYYGKMGHPETEGVLGIADDIILITDNTDIDSLGGFYNKPILTNQTTMAFIDVYALYNKLKHKIPNLELNEEICGATRRRQEAVLSYKDNLDLCIVVGDSLSNNTRKLKDISEKAGIKTIQIESTKDLENCDLSPYETVGVTAGASTPENIIHDVLKLLKNRYPNK